MKRFSRLCATTLVVAFLFVSMARAQVLDQVPEQALVVVKVSNLESTSAKFAKFATELQLVAQVPQLADPLAALQEKLKIQNGLDKAGEAAFAYLDPALADGNEDEAMVILIPVTDYKAFIGNFQEPKEEGGITEVTFEDAPKPAFIANWGKYAAMSPSKAIASLKPAGVKVTGATAQELGTKDIVMLANFQQLKGKLQPQLAEGKEEILTSIDREMTDDKAKWAPAAKTAMTQIIGIADAFLRDVQAATLSINFVENGIATTLMAEFEPESYIGTFSKNLKTSESSMLTGLPAGKYLVFGGSVNDPESFTKLFDDIVKPITDEVAKVEGPEAAAINKYVDSIRKYMVATKSQSFGWVAPTGALGQEPIFQILSIQQGDPAAMKQAYQDMMSTQQELMQALGAPQDAMKITTTPDAKTLGGVSFDLTKTEMNVGEGANAAQADNAMKMIYGPEGMTSLTGVVDDKLVIGVGASDETLTNAIAAIKANEDPMGKLAGVATVSSQLPKSRAFSLYVPLDEVVTTVSTYAGAMGMPIQIQLPPDLPPIGVTAGTEGSAIRIDSYTPTDLVRALVAAGMQIYMQQMQGGQGGPGGL